MIDAEMGEILEPGCEVLWDVVHMQAWVVKDRPGLRERLRRQSSAFTYV